MGKFVVTKELEKLKQRYFITRKVSLAPGANKRFSMMIVSMIVVFGLGYVWQINNTATLGYQMKDLEYRAAELKKSTHDLRIEIAEAQSTARLMERLEETDMVAVGSISYVNAIGTDVAVNR